MQHCPGSGKAIVLVHGLTDSPYFMSAIAEYFYGVLGYDVYMPLLQWHGLKQPDNMSGVLLQQWEENVRFAICTAAGNSDRVSLGGLSMGGTLGFYLGCSEKEVSGDLYFFSAAFGLYGGQFEMYRWIKESLLRTPLLRFLDSKRPLVGDNPYRYDRIPVDSAGELAQLIRKNNILLRGFGKGNLLEKRIFCAWSECDKVVSIKALRNLNRVTVDTAFIPFVIPEAAGVDHACVVLKEPVYAISAQPGDAPLEDANPLFAKMMIAIKNFEAAG